MFSNSGDQSFFYCWADLNFFPQSLLCLPLKSGLQFFYRLSYTDTHINCEYKNYINLSTAYRHKWHGISYMHIMPFKYELTLSLLTVWVNKIEQILIIENRWKCYSISWRTALCLQKVKIHLSVSDWFKP